MNKKRLWICTLILGYFCLFTISYSLELSSSWYANFDTLLVDGVLYEVTIDSEGETVFLTSQEEGIVHYLNLGSRLEINNYEIFFSSNEYVYDEIDEDLRYYRALLVLNLLDPVIESSVTLIDDGLYLGEEYKFEIVIENNGTADITGVNYSFVYNDLFEVSQKSRCGYDSSRIFFTVDIKKERSFDCTYILIPKKPFSGDIVGEVSYITETFVREFVSEEVIIVEPISIDVLAADESINLSTESNISFTFSHNSSSDVDLVFTFHIPELLENIDIPRQLDFVQSSTPGYGYDLYEYVKTFDEGDEVDFAVIFDPDSSKDLTFFYEYEYTYNNFDFQSDIYTIDIEVTDSNIDEDITQINYSDIFNFTINISGDDQFYAVQTDSINLDFKNRLRENITNVVASVYIDGELHKAYYYPVVTQFLRIILPEYEYTAPFVTEDTDLDLEFFLSYTANNTNYSASLTRTFTVRDIPSATITKTVSDEEISVSESTFISVTANYEGESRSFPYLFNETIPDGFEVNGITQRTVRLIGGDEELDIYEYELVAKDVENETEYNIITTAFASVEGQEQTFLLNSSVSITVLPYEDGLDLSNDQTSTDLRLGELLSVDVAILQNGTTPIYDVTIYPLRDEGQGISYSPLFFEQLNPGDEREYSYDLRFTEDVPNASSSIYYSYFTPKGIFIERVIDIFEANLLTNDTATYGPIGIIFANQTNYGEYNTTILTASRSYNELLFYSNNYTIPISQTTTIINDTNDVMYVTYSYLERVFEQSVPVSTFVYVAPEPEVSDANNSQAELINEESEEVTAQDSNENNSLSFIQALLIGFGVFVFVTLAGLIYLELKKRNSNSASTSMLFSKASPNLANPILAIKQSKQLLPSLKEKLVSLKKPEATTKKKEFSKIIVQEQKPVKVPIVEMKKTVSASSVNKPEEKQSSLSVAQQLKQSRELLNKLKK